MKGCPAGSDNICKILSAPYPFFALLAGMQLGVFKVLKEKGMDVEQISAAIGVNPAKMRPLLYALVAAKLLAIGEGEFFANTRETNQFLVPDSPSYMCDHVYCNVNPLIMSWIGGALKTSASIRTGKPQIDYDFSALSQDELEKGFRATHPITLRAGGELASKYDFSSFSSLVDVAGGVGGLSIAITAAYPNLKATVIELPQIGPIARRFVEEAHATEMVQTIACDILNDNLDCVFDVAVVRAFIQVLSPDKARKAFKNVYKITKPSGVIFVLGHILDDSRISPLEEIWCSILNMNFYHSPGSYTEGEYKNWLIEAGFVQIERDSLPNGDGVMVARKPEK
jgi:SAM-dependent methyltransferase